MNPRARNPGNTRFRRAIKRLLQPVKGGMLYSFVQALTIAFDIKFRRFYEAEIDFVSAAVKSGETVLDVGANFGLYTYHLAKAVGRHGRVICFEPIPYTFNTLKLIVMLMRLTSVDLRPIGLSDSEGSVTFRVPLQENGHIMAGQVHMSDRFDDHGDVDGQVRWRETRELLCPVSTIDIQCDSVARLSFIKLDIEGAEIFALRGGQVTIERFLPTLLLEINPWFLDGFRVSFPDLTSPMFKLGYSLYFYDSTERKLRIVTVEDDIIERNYVFIHPLYLCRFSEFLS